MKKVCILLVLLTHIAKDIPLHPYILSASVTEFPRSSEVPIILLVRVRYPSRNYQMEDQPLSGSTECLLLTFTANHKGTQRHFPPIASSASITVHYTLEICLSSASITVHYTLEIYLSSASITVHYTLEICVSSASITVHYTLEICLSSAAITVHYTFDICLNL